MTNPTTRRWLCLPPIILCLFDHVITMISQPVEYWDGNLASADEANPVVYFVMERSHLFYQIMPPVWLALVSIIILKSPRPLALWVCLSVTLGHMFCACTWYYYQPDGYYASLAVCLASAGVLSLALERWRDRDDRNL